MTECSNTDTDNRPITQSELDQFKELLLTEMNARFDAFIEDFVEVCQSKLTEDGDGEDSCDCTDVENPARYVLFSGGQKYFATEIKPNAFSGVDFFLKEVDQATGKEYNSKGTITSPDVVIVDLKPDMTLEMFTAIKQNTLDYVVAMAQEAKVQEEAAKKVSQPPKDVSVMSYT
jgi:hypothetical protein